MMLHPSQNNVSTNKSNGSLMLVVSRGRGVTDVCVAYVMPLGFSRPFLPFV